MVTSLSSQLKVIMTDFFFVGFYPILAIENLFLHKKVIRSHSETYAPRPVRYYMYQLNYMFCTNKLPPETQFSKSLS